MIILSATASRYADECSLTNRVLDRSHFRRARPVRVQLVQFPRTQQRRSKKDCVLPLSVMGVSHR
jgi:hypothetical protein